MAYTLVSISMSSNVESKRLILTLRSTNPILASSPLKSLISTIILRNIRTPNRTLRYHYFPLALDTPLICVEIVLAVELDLGDGIEGMANIRQVGQLVPFIAETRRLGKVLRAWLDDRYKEDSWRVCRSTFLSFGSGFRLGYMAVWLSDWVVHCWVLPGKDPLRGVPEPVRSSMRVWRQYDRIKSYRRSLRDAEL